MPRAHGQDLSRALPGHRVERSCAVGMARISQELCQVIGWREAVPRAHGQDLSIALPGHRVERSCAVGTWPAYLKSTARS